ncbi:cell division protein FtsZ, partial [Listeria seeligeri FSL N1-067]
NMIFGSVINDELKDELIVTVIATGFDEAKQAQQQSQANRRPNNQSIQVNRPSYAVQDEPQNDYAQSAPQQANNPGHEQQAEPQQNSSDVDVPAFIRNRNRRG